MDGDIAPVPELLALCERHDAYLMVDDAHGFGVIGPEGRGTAAHFGLASPCQCGRVCRRSRAGYDAPVIEWILQRARSYMFATGAPAMVAATLRASLKVIFTLLPSDTAIQPLIVGSNACALQLMRSRPVLRLPPTCANTRCAVGGSFTCSMRICWLRFQLAARYHFSFRRRLCSLRQFKLCLLSAAGACSTRRKVDSASRRSCSITGAVDTTPACAYQRGQCAPASAPCTQPGFGAGISARNNGANSDNAWPTTPKAVPAAELSAPAQGGIATTASAECDRSHFVLRTDTPRCTGLRFQVNFPLCRTMPAVQQSLCGAHQQHPSAPTIAFGWCLRVGQRLLHRGTGGLRATTLGFPALLRLFAA